MSQEKRKGRDNAYVSEDLWGGQGIHVTTLWTETHCGRPAATVGQPQGGDHACDATLQSTFMYSECCCCPLAICLTVQAPAANVLVLSRKGMRVWRSGIMTRAMHEGDVYVGVFCYSRNNADGEYATVCMGTAESDIVSFSK